MLDRRIGLLLIGAAGVGAYLFQTFLVPVEVEFTRSAPPPAPTIDMRPTISTAHLAIPVDLSRVGLRTEAALAHRLASGLDALDPACSRRQPPPECGNAVKLDGAVSLASPAVVEAKGATLRVRLPLKIEATQAGERTSHEISIGFAFAVRGGAGGFEVARIEESAVDAAGAAAPVRLIRQLEARLKPLGLTAQEELRLALAAVPVTTATERAWNALSQPIELAAGSGLWLKSVPEVAGSGELIAVNGGIQLRVPIATRLSLEVSERPPAATRRPVIQGQVNMSGNASIRMATRVPLDALQQAVTQALVKGGTLESRADRFGPPVKIDVRRARVYPSARQLAVEMSLSASRYEGQVFHGKAHLVGRPVLDAASGVVTLADISFPAAVQREAGSARTVPGAPRLSSEPFAGRLAGIARIDVARDVSEALPRVNSLLHQRIDDRLSMAARLTAAAPVALEIVRDGAWLLTELTGELILGYDGPVEPANLARVVERPAEAPPSKPGRALPTPEVAAAAVVTAAPLPAAAPPAQQAAGGTAPLPAAAPLPSLSAAPAPAEATQPPTPARTALPKRPYRPSVARSAAKQPAQPVDTGSREWVPFAK